MSRAMLLAELLPDVAGIPAELVITGLVQDSRALRPGDAFVAVLPARQEVPSSHGLNFAAQARAVFANVRAVLEASGARWEDLVDVTVFLTDMERDFTAYNAAWAEHFPDPAGAPCRTTLGITALPTPIAIELKCVAVVKE